MTARKWPRIFAGSLIIISTALPWYMRSDPGQTLNLISFLLNWNPVSPIQIAIIILLLGGVLSLFSGNGVSLLALGFVSTTLVLEDYRMYHLDQNLPYGPGFYIAIVSIFICLLDTVIESRNGNKAKEKSNEAE